MVRVATYPDLKGKVAIVTGSGRAKGLGEAMVRRLAAEGCCVVVSDIGAPRGAQIPAEAIGSSRREAKEAGATRTRTAS